MFKIINTVEDRIIFSGNSSEFINFVKIIVRENEDFEFSILDISDAEDYIENYCGNLIYNNEDKF